jgi:uncharacterized membrane protein (UPF0127 family)
MRAVRVDTQNTEREELIASKVIKAENFLNRLFGLTVRRKLKAGEGFYIECCSSIHTFWMRYSIDAVFLDKKNKVVAVYNSIRPFRVTRLIKNAFSVLELDSGTIERTSLSVGDPIRFI